PSPVGSKPPPWADRQNATAVSLLASIPSPSSGTLELGPLTIHMYGLTLLVAIGVCTWVTGKRWVNRGGDWDLIFRCAVWGVGAGIVGARLYHVITSWDEVPDAWWGPFAIWRGGLGVWGGIALGCLVGGIVAKRSGVDVWLLADCLAPGLLLAQGIGRLGNWWNQELFGKPTDLPWGLEIDPAHHIAGLRLNAWVSLLGVAAGVLWYVLSQRNRTPRPRGTRKARPTKPSRTMAVPGERRVRPPG
ncbi:MAG TPA: prolipoprotein diacylglyceryl transferase, partial [Gaiella sp.]|nr:prolipoprotein diacylglyceryl transferase [Gaiella sp.]